MVALLRCPAVSLDRMTEYLQHSNDQQKFSNFGYCETLLRRRLADRLKVPHDRTSLGSSATSLLSMSSELTATGKMGVRRVYFPVFSFFSTFSIASNSPNEAVWYDVDSKTMLPCFHEGIEASDIVYMNVPFGSPKITPYLDLAKHLPCLVVIDAAACLPGLLYQNRDLSDLPDNVIIVFSLHATKLLSSGEGGYCVFGKKVPGHIQQLTNFGIDPQRRQSWKRSCNAKMSEFNAAAGLCGLDLFEHNAQLVMQAKNFAQSVSQQYELTLFEDINVPTLTINMQVSNAKSLIKPLAAEGYETRQWWSLSDKLDPERHRQSIALHNGLLGVPFDWSCIETYFEDLCSRIRRLQSDLDQRPPLTAV